MACKVIFRLEPFAAVAQLREAKEAEAPLRAGDTIIT